MFKPGDVVVANFMGAVIIKRRPAVVLSSAIYHANRPDYILGLITTQVAAVIGPTDYALQDWIKIGLRQPFAFRSFFCLDAFSVLLLH